MWLSVHLVYLPGFRNRWAMLLNWLHGYSQGDRAIRVILSTPMTAKSLPAGAQGDHSLLLAKSTSRFWEKGTLTTQ